MCEIGDKVYVSITGLTLKSPFHAVMFMWHASQSHAQAVAAPGNISTQTRTVDGVHHTLTVWTSRKAMLAYLRSGAHLRAMKAYPAIGTGKVHGYWASTQPDWAEALKEWRREGRVV